MYGCKSDFRITDAPLVELKTNTEKENNAISKETPINTLKVIMSDMDSCGEAIPMGVPTSTNWRECPRISYGNNPKNFKAVLPWGQLYISSEGNHSVNTRVQIQNLYVYYLSKAKKRWILWTGSKDVEGNYYVEDYQNDTHISKVNFVKGYDGSVSVKLIPNYNYQFWSTKGRAEINPSDIDGVWAYCEARLINEDSTKPDDKEKAKYILSIGADYWLDKNVLWDASWSNNGDVAIGRFKYVTKQWRAFNMHTLSKEQIIKSPPPRNILR